MLSSVGALYLRTRARKVLLCPDKNHEISVINVQRQYLRYFTSDAIKLLMTISRFLPILFFLTSLQGIKAEDRAIIPLTFLVAHSKKIVQAIYLENTMYSCTFLTKELGSNDVYKDTFTTISNVQAIHRITNTTFKDTVSFDIKNSKEFLLFIDDTSGMVEGLFMGVHDKVYVISYLEFGDKWSFFKIPDTVSWKGFIQRTIDIKNRFAPLFKLKNSPNSRHRNKALLEWLETSLKTYDMDCGLYDDCGWGWIESQVLQWIADSGIIEDAWSASKMFRRINCLQGSSPWCESDVFYGGRNKFRSEKNIQFLLRKALDHRLPMVERNQALAFMEDAVLGLYKCSVHKYPNICYDRNPRLRSFLLDKIMPLLYNPDMNYFAFKVIRNLSDPMDERNLYPVTLLKMPELKSLYQASKFEASNMRTELGTFLNKNCGEKEWEAISGNKKNILMSLASISYDSSIHSLNLWIYYLKNNPQMTAIPKIIFEKIINQKIDTTLVKETYLPFSIPLQWNYSQQEIRIRVDDLSQGTWHFYLKGSAGEHGEYEWESEGGTFVQR